MLVVHNAEDVPERVDDRRGDESGPALDRLLVHRRAHGDQPVDHFGRHFRIDGELDDGRTRIRLAAPTPLDIARNLAGWGAMIEVVEPRSVQAELARIGAELAARYPN